MAPWTDDVATRSCEKTVRPVCGCGSSSVTGDTGRDKNYGDNDDRMSRLAATVLVSGGLGLAGLNAATAYADPGYIEPIGPYHWCPGGPPLDVNWDQSVCHTYWHVATGAGNVGGPDDLHDNDWDGPNPPRVPIGPCFAM